MKYNALPSREKLMRLFEYNEQTGALKWKERRLGVNADRIAGVCNGRYIVIRVDGRLYAAHRLIWKMVTGHDPENQIDHIDLNKTNNKWANLRPAHNGQNMMNVGLIKSNTSGFKGVARCHNKWTAYVKVNGKTQYFGLHESREVAAEIVAKERARLHGEFARSA